MDYVKLSYNNHSYCYKEGSCLKMDLLGCFLSSDVRCPDPTHKFISYQEWIQNDALGMSTSGNITYLEKEGNHVYLSDLYSEEETPTRLKILRCQLVQLLNDWQEKVCKRKPKEVLIKHEDENQFSIETHD
jgi:hypothetical protein